MLGERAWPVAIVALGPIACASLLSRSRGELRITVVVKATFALQPGGDMTSVDPAAVVAGEIHDDDPARTLRAASDLAPYLPRADVVVTGHACAPRGAAVTDVPVRVAVYRDHVLLDKALHVHGDAKDGAPQPFTRMPLTGFGPIASTAPQRARLLGGIDRAALAGPVLALPASLDWAYFQSAPEDQRVEYLHGSEWVLLEGLHPDVPILRSRLPDAHAAARVFGLTRGAPDAARPVGLNADTLRIDADDLRCSVVYRGVIPVRDEKGLDEICIVAALDRPDSPIAWPESREEARVAGSARAAEERAAEALAEEALELSTIDIVPDEEPAAPAPPKAPVPIPVLPSPAVVVRPAPKLSEMERTLDLSAVKIERPAPKLSEMERTLDLSAVKIERPVPKPLPFERTLDLTPTQSRSAGTTAATPFAPQDAPAARAPGAAPAVPGAPWSPEAAPVAPPVPAEGEEELDHTLAFVEETAPVPPPQGLPAAASPAAPAAPVSPAAPTPAAPFFHRIERPAAHVAEPDAEIVPSRRSETVPVLTRAPLLAFTLPWPEAKRDARVVVVKGTFDLVPDGPAAARAEADPVSGDVHVDDDPMHSVLHPSDLVPFKPKADVVLKGHAYAPGGSSPAALARFRFGHRGAGFDRSIAVFGDRRWQEALVKVAPTEPIPFEKVPLVYERAYGGRGFDANPVGAGHDDARVPNLEDPAHLIKSPGDAPAPAGFGAVPMLWRARWSRIGSFDASWAAHRWPDTPEDFDWAFFQSAPPAQQLDHVEGDEPFDLSGVHPDHARLSGALPGVRPRCFAQRTTAAGGAFSEVPLRLDTVSFDVDAMKLNLVWRGVAIVEDDEASDLAELFVLSEPLAGPHAELAEARAQYREAKAPPPAPPAPGPLPPPAPRLPPHLDPVRARVIDLLARGAPLDGEDLSGADLSDLDMSRRSLVATNLYEARLARCRFHGADLTSAQLAGADLTDAVLDEATLRMADFTGANLDAASFAGAYVSAAAFVRARGDGANFGGMRGTRASFAGGTFARASFARADLPGADFTGATLDDAVFDGASLPEVRLYDARGRGASFKNAVLAGARADGVALPNGALQGVTAPSSVWEGAELDGATFRGAKLEEASFARASCRRAVFSGADLARGRLRRAKLAGASLLKANLMEASLEGADLTSADLRGANLHGAETWKAKLDGAQLDLAIMTRSKLARERR